jgi:hypothetical protein
MVADPSGPPRPSSSLGKTPLDTPSFRPHVLDTTHEVEAVQRATIRIAPNRRSGGERVFTDDEGRLWSAALEQRDALDGALVFRCISDGRQSVRALFVDPLALSEAGDDALRAWLRAAPRIGTLS